MNGVTMARNARTIASEARASESERERERPGVSKGKVSTTGASERSCPLVSDAHEGNGEWGVI